MSGAESDDRQAPRNAQLTLYSCRAGEGVQDLVGAYRPALEEKIRFGKRFAALPEKLKKRWWEWTYYGKHPPTNELMWTIEAVDEELADYLSKLLPLGETR